MPLLSHPVQRRLALEHIQIAVLTKLPDYERIVAFQDDVPELGNGKT
jgi:hypothetical protein